MIDIDNTNAQINNPAEYDGLICIKARLYPSPEQCNLLNRTFGCVRVAKNMFIRNKREHDAKLIKKLTNRFLKRNKNVKEEDVTFDDLMSVINKKTEHFYSLKDAQADLLIKKNTKRYCWLNDVNSKVLQ